ncbi:MAG TPA: hypothetical protein VEC99_01180 [Clostridia bacterium]|nr:hypothetical protein [Clostridia bacterium]
MDIQTQSEELVLKPSPTKWFWMTTGFFVGGVVSISMFVQHEWLGWVFFPLMACGTVFSASVPFLNRMHLRLSPSDFTFGTLKRRYKYRWSDIASFLSLSIGSQLRTVGFDFSPSFSGEQEVRRFNQEFSGFDRFLPDTYGMQPLELAKLLESWRVKCGNSREH